MGILGRNLHQEALSKIDWQRHIRSFEDWFGIRGRNYHKLLEIADGLVAAEANDEAAVVQLLAAAVSMNLQPNTPGDPFRAIYRVGDATSPTIEDFDEADVVCMAVLAQQCDDLWLKARLLDVACSAGQRLGLKVWQWGTQAAPAYLDCCEEHIERESSIWICAEVHRGVALCWTFGKKDDALQERCWDIVRRGIHHALNQGWIGVYHPFSELVRNRNRELIEEFAPVFEAHARRFADADGNIDSKNAQVCYEIAARLWERAGNIESSRRSECAAAEILVARANSSTQAMLRADWMAEGIAKLRRYHGDRARIEELERELESARRSIEDEMHPHEFKIDLRELMEHVHACVVGPTTQDALLQLAFGIGAGPSHNHARKSVLEMHDKYPFSSIFDEVELNRAGVPVARRDAFDPSDEAQVYERMIKEVRTADAFVLSKAVLEGIDLVFEQFGISYNTMLMYAHQSPAVPERHEESVTRGLMAGFHHDWLEVAAFLIPQTEAIVRNIFGREGKRTLSDRGDSTEEEMPLNQLLGHPDAVKVLGKDFVFQLRAFLTEKSGYNMRNLYAHGLMDDDAVHTDGLYCLWWTMLRVVLFVPWGAEWMQAMMKKGEGNEPG